MGTNNRKKIHEITTMKLPNSFRPIKDLDDKTNQLTREAKILKKPEIYKKYDNVCFLLDTSGSMSEHYIETVGTIFDIARENNQKDKNYAIVGIGMNTSGSGWLSTEQMANCPDLGEINYNLGGPGNVEPNKLEKLLSAEPKTFTTIMLTDNNFFTMLHGDQMEALKKMSYNKNRLCLICLSEGQPIGHESIDFADIYSTKRIEESADLMKRYSTFVMNGEKKPQLRGMF